MFFVKQSLAIFFGFLVLIASQARIAVADDVVGADDVLRISVYGYDDLKTETRVLPSGRISFPLVGELYVAGKSTFDIERELTEALIKGRFVRDPQVTVVVLEMKSQQVSVLGQVKQPGRYPLTAGRTLVDVIAMAGGVDTLGEEKAIVTRRMEGQMLKEEIDLRAGLESFEGTGLLQIQPGDVVYVPKAPMFYIHGEVQRAGAYRLEPNLTVAQALSLGGGLSPRGTVRRAVIMRRTENGNQSIRVKLTDLVKKDDVIVIAERWF